MFHVEHEIDLVALFAVLNECRLPDSQQASDGNLKARFLAHLTDESRTGVLSELHMAAG